MKKVTILRLVLLLAALVGLALGADRLLLADCEEGCAEGQCFELDGECVYFNKTTCPNPNEHPEIWAESDYGPVGGTCTEYEQEKQTDKSIYDVCGRECGHDKSRAHDGPKVDDLSCSGPFTSEGPVAKHWCKDDS